MKVLLIDVYNYNKGGAETVCFNTGKLLIQNGHQAVYFTLKWPENNPSSYSKYFPESKETRKGPFKSIKNLINYFYCTEAAKNIELLIKEEKPDIAHIHLMWGQITPSIFPVLKKYHIPIIFTVHDYRIVCPAYTFRNGKGKICEECQGHKFYKCFINSCTKGSKILSAIMASEQYFRNYFFNPSQYINGFIYVSNFAKSIQEKYMPILKNTPNITLYNFSTSIIEAIKICPSEKYFLYFGRLSYEKGVKTLMKAFEKLPDSKLKIVGTGPIEKELHQYKQQRNLQNIEFLGYKKGNELTNLVKNAYFVIVPSEWYENNPMTIIEAYSVGTPVIGSQIGGIPEIILNERTGYQFKSFDTNSLITQIQKANLLSNEQYRKFSLETIDFAKKYLSIENYYPRLIKFYQEFIDK